jgi:hypothetical protein
MEFTYNDGGRLQTTGKANVVGDCVCRAIAITSKIPYDKVWEILSNGNANQRLSSRQKTKRSKTAANGINTKRKWFKDLMKNLGYTWHPTMNIGSGCKVHLSKDELPDGKIIASVSKHYVAIIDGVINDIYDCSRNETRCVYGYWEFDENIK